ncbi:hypothetical protein [Caballeronia sp. dw_19]|uniref:hypothetical protein n=1 Tax=Caballeronia sp. dw_19 TaxID=2719791 RepID=UPI001BD5C987|nr:hypothetical protein [Caballeronia sp. dw_19]
MKHTFLTLALAATALHATAASTDPFDFDYEITGNVLERPALVFNDGDATYLQPRAGQDLKVEGGRNQGPYIVVSGTPETIRYTVNGSSASAQWKRANHFMGGKGLPGAQNNGDLPSGFVGFSDRLALIGTRTRLDSTRALSATLPLSQLVKALVPQGWTGSAQKEVDLTAASSFATRDGENWMQSLDRLMIGTGLYADVDFDKRHVSLRRMAPKSAAVNYVAPSASSAVASSSDPIAAIATQNSGPLRDSLLASKFGALAIRDGDDTHVQIRFASKPSKELKVVDAAGASLKPKWDDASNVLTINRSDRSIFSDGTDQVEVARVAGTVYEFDTGNSASLEAVFDKDGATFFKFSETVGHVTVSDARNLGSGEQKGRYYKFNGTADQFIVNADGNVANVIRKRDVRFFDRPKS